jgi:hypothetical protein
MPLPAGGIHPAAGTRNLLKQVEEVTRKIIYLSMNFNRDAGNYTRIYIEDVTNGRLVPYGKATGAGEKGRMTTDRRPQTTGRRPRTTD